MQVIGAIYLLLKVVRRRIGSVADTSTNLVVETPDEPNAQWWRQLHLLKASSSIKAGISGIRAV